MSSPALGWIAALLVVGAGVLWFRAAFAVRLPEDRRGYAAIWVAGAALGVAALAGGAGWAGGVPAVVAIVGAAFFLFTIGISRQQAAPDVIAVGAPLPGFSAPDENGATFESTNLAGHPALLKFFRGHW
jgi:hypothetical protein